MLGGPWDRLPGGKAGLSGALLRMIRGFASLPGQDWHGRDDQAGARAGRLSRGPRRHLHHSEGGAWGMAVLANYLWNTNEDHSNLADK